MNKRLISLCMALFLFFSLASFSSAIDTTSKLTPKLAAETVALSFMRNSISDAIEIAETTPYYDISGNVTAFVMDGWYDCGRFGDFDYIPVVKGIKVWIGPTAN